MNLQQNLNEYWRNLEKKSKPPSHVSKLNIVDFKNIKKAIDNKNIFYIKNLMRKMYNGEAFILRNAAKKNLKNIIIKLAKHYDKKHKPSFYKMYDGAPNFHRIINKNITIMKLNDE